MSVTMRFQNPPWMLDGACLGMDPDLWFPGQGESTREAKAVCATCPVRDECLEHALANSIKHGIWGGKSERERRIIRRDRNLQRGAA